MELWMKIIIVVCMSYYVGLLIWILLYSLRPIDDTKLDFVTWYELNEEELYITFAETGEDRELDFNAEAACDREYEKYLNQLH